MSIRNLIESAIKGDALSFNETFTGIMNEAAVDAVEEAKNPVTADDVVDLLIGLGVLTIEEAEAEDFTEETLLELSKKTLGSYVKKASDSKGSLSGEYQKNSSEHDTNRRNMNSVHTKSREASDAMRKASDAVSKEHNEKQSKIEKKYLNRDKGIGRAVDKLTKEETEVAEEIVDEGKSYRSGDEKYSDIKKLKKNAAERRNDRKNKRQVEEETEQLDELSSRVLGSYVRKASKQVYNAAYMSKGGAVEGMTKIANKRLDGVQRAANSIQNKKD